MCNFKNWYYDDNGYVVQCLACNFYRMGFGSTLLTLTEKDYQFFFKLVCNTKEAHIAMHDVGIKCILLPTPCKSIHIMLNETELNELYSMMQEADIEMKTQQLLDLFSTGNS